MKQFLVLVAITVCTLSTVAQQKSNRKKDATGKGALFLHWGYNRSAYTQSNMHFQGQGYDFNMADVRAHDNLSELGWHYFDPKVLTVPQFNVRVGYYFKDNWAISIGYDHLKYIFADQNRVRLSGYIEPGLDEVSHLSGSYDNYDYVTDRSNFHYENSDGLNYLRVEVLRSQQWYKTRSGWFAFTTNVGLSAGGLLSYNDFRFAGEDTRRTISLSGYGLSAHLGLRFEFWNHLFLQANYGGGFMHQIGVKTRPNDATAKVSQKFGFMEMNVALGGIFYIRTKNGCGTCPKW